MNIQLRRFIRIKEQKGWLGGLAEAGRLAVIAVRQHGPVSAARRLLSSPPPGWDLPQRQPKHIYDLEHGVTTSGFIAGERLPLLSFKTAYTTAYYGIEPSPFRIGIRQVPIDPSRFTFLDLGCGMGRALLLAAELPFPRLIGAELFEELLVIARDNVRKLGLEARVELLQQDVTTMTFPEGPLLVFLYSPFAPAILKRVLTNLERQLRKQPRETYVLYAGAVHYAPVTAEFAFLERLWEVPIPLSLEERATSHLDQKHEVYTLHRSVL